VAAHHLPCLWQNPQTPFLTAAMQNRALVGIGGVQFQKQNLNPDGFPPALSSSGGLAEVCPGTEKLEVERPQR